ncbi:MAG: hypothetical protein JST16_04600 [Bdellovibrionales bacterium]|nr:hypothetical protein [Bdellovibrionales bacterium]
MFYHNTKYKFELWQGSPSNLAGGIIAASAMFIGQLRRRKFRKWPYLQHRLFDPQLYLAALDERQASTTVPTLATFPWFGGAPVDDYDSKQHKSQKGYKEATFPKLLANWRRTTVSDDKELRAAARSAVEFQLELDCRGIILPAPIVDRLSDGYESATVWIDAGLDACRSLGVTLPVYATVAVADTILQGIPAAANPVIASITSHIAARKGLAGAYLVLESRDGDCYSIESQDTARALLRIVDDLVRGARRRVVVNYSGTFGAVCMAAGAEIWSTGYYLSQRRLKLSDMYKKDGGAQFPRYFSLQLLGDIGVEQDLQTVAKAGLLDEVRTPSSPAKPLLEALASGLGPDQVPAWAYRLSNVAAAGAHYNNCMHYLGKHLEGQDSAGRVNWMEHWLAKAAAVAKRLSQSGISHSRSTDIDHQETWLTVFREWRAEAGR